MEKKLYKNPAKKKIAGVCQGIAEYFNVDPTIVRVIWGLLFFAYGFGLGLYILMWIILPDKEEAIGVIDDDETFYKK